MAEGLDSPLDEINNGSFESVIVQPIDPWDTAWANAIDLHQFVGNDVEAHKKEPVGNQLILDDLADMLLTRCYLMGKHPSACMHIGTKFSFLGLPAHGPDDFTVEQ